MSKNKALPLIAVASLFLVSHCHAIMAQKRGTPPVDFASIGPISAEATEPNDPPAENKYKNIRVLQGLPSSQLVPVMAMIANSLGTTCSHCHSEHFEEETIPEKETARKMIRMTRAINAGTFDGTVMVTCHSCHNGKVFPNPIPEVADAGWLVKPPAPAAALPSAESLLAKYYQATGAKQSLANVQTLGGRGTMTLVWSPDDTEQAPFELEVRGPDQVEVHSDLDEPDALAPAIARFAALRPDIENAYRRLKVTGTATVDGRDAFVVQGTPRSGRLEQLYFDAASGQLLRIHTETVTALGYTPQELTLSDYRPGAGGALIPGTIRWARGEGQVTLRFER
jgi:Photosynthetic reaction centre cytochrome C subunit